MTIGPLMSGGATSVTAYQRPPMSMHMSLTATQLFAGSDYANEWLMSGTNDREVQGAPATGRAFRVRGASVGKLDTRTSSDKSTFPTSIALTAGALAAAERRRAGETSTAERTRNSPRNI